MPGRLSINTLVYARAFVEKAWATRDAMEDYERRGFFQFLYVAACSHAESVISDYLKAVLFFPLHLIKNEVNFPLRKFTVDEHSRLISQEPEQRAVQRILERTLEELDRAPFDRIEGLHKTIVGEPINAVIGVDLHDDLLGLVSARNLLAHGRHLFIEIDDITHQADVTFEKHPLENAIKSLRQANLFQASKAQALPPHEVQGVIYQDDAMRHFWNASVEIGDIYRKRGDDGGYFAMGRTPRLTPLPK